MKAHNTMDVAKRVAKLRPLIAVAVLVVAAAAAPAAQPVLASQTAPQGRPAVELRWFGALRAMMHEGKTGAVVRTDDVVPGPHTYAVGALSELRGEITVIDDRIWYSYPDGKSFRTEAGASSPEACALLVVARVERWEEIVVERDLTLPEFEETLAELEAQRARRVAPVFRIEAVFPRLELHVVDGSKIKPGTSAREHHAASVRIESKNVPATLIGFHSDSHQGIFTHHDQTTHIHAVLVDPLVTGHVDAAIVPKGAILKLPLR